MAKIKESIKIKYIKMYENGEISQGGIARSLGVSKASVQQWIINYKSMGEEAFTRNSNKGYTTELKMMAVQDYLAGLGSQQNICEKYGIRARSKLQDWIMKYNGHETLKSSVTGGTIMTKGRKTNFEDRVDIVNYCIAHNHNYSEAAEKFGVSYQQARNYTIKYESHGIDGLLDRRGIRKEESELTEVEKLQAEIKMLKAQNEKAQMELSFLKKLEEIERRRD